MVKLDTNKKIKNYNNTYANNKGLYLYKLYANWCGHCTNMENDWNNFIKNNSSLLKDINIVEIESEHLRNIKNKNLQVSGFPSILLFNDNKLIDTFSSNRTEKEFVKFIEKNKSQVGGSIIINELQQLLIPATLLATRHLIKNKTISNLNIFKNKSFKNKFTNNISKTISRTIKDGQNNFKSIANITQKNVRSIINRGKKSVKNLQRQAKSGIKKALITPTTKSIINRGKKSIKKFQRQAKSGIKKALITPTTKSIINRGKKSVKKLQRQAKSGIKKAFK